VDKGRGKGNDLHRTVQCYYLTTTRTPVNKIKFPNAKLNPVLNKMKQWRGECGHIIKNILVLVLNLKEIWLKSNMHTIQTNI
jgi:hypothetical protein